MKKNPFIITENDRRNILSMYGILMETINDYTFSGVIKGKDDLSIIGVKCEIIDDSNKQSGRTISDSEGKFTITTKLDDSKKYRIKFSLSGYIDYFYDIDFTKTDFTNINIVLEEPLKQLGEVGITASKGSYHPFYGTHFKVTIKNKEQKIITGSKIELFYGDKKVNLENIKEDEGSYFIVTDLNPELKDVLYPKISDGIANVKDTQFNVKIIKNKSSEEKQITLSVPNKILKLKYVEGTLDKKKEKFYWFQNKEVLRKSSLYGDIVDLTGIKLTAEQEAEIENKFVRKIQKLGYSDANYKDMTNGTFDFSDIAKKLKYDDYVNFGDKLNNIDITLDTFINFNLSITDDLNQPIVDTNVKIYLDRNKETLSINEITDENGNISDVIDLINEEGDRINKKRSLWIEINKEGYEPYFKKSVIKIDDTNIDVVLKKIVEKPIPTIGDIEIKILDRNKKGIANASLTLELSDGTEIGKVNTDNNGVYILDNLESYLKKDLYITVDADGYTGKIKKFKVRDNNNNFRVKLKGGKGATYEPVEVTPSNPNFITIPFIQAEQKAKKQGNNILVLVGMRNDELTEKLLSRLNKNTLANKFLKIYYDVDNSDDSGYVDFAQVVPLKTYPAVTVLDYDNDQEEFIPTVTITDYEELENINSEINEYLQ
jgi:hypothetical protein